MKKLQLITRILLGLVYFIFGLNAFLNFIPPPPDLEPKFLSFMEVMMASRLFYLIKAAEVVGGLMFLTNKLLALGTVILAPISVGIVVFHTAMTPPSQWAMGIVMLVCHLLLAWTQKDRLAPLFKN